MHRVAAIVERYPQLSETYISTEVSALARTGHLVRLVALYGAKLPQIEHEAFVRFHDEDDILAACVDAEVTMLHSHYLHLAPLVARVARRANVPFTVRTHSYDVLKASPESIREMCGAINRSSCTAVLGFPFICERLRAAGLRDDLLVESWPVIDYRLFHDTSANGTGVINVGAALAKKNMTGYIDFARRAPHLEFSLYPVGYDTAELSRYNEENGAPVDIRPAVQPSEMPRVYKSHRWLVYSASLELNTVGWPMAVAEAQASGLGVCLQSNRADADLYLGGAGVAFVAFEEITELIAGPVPADMRERGFAVAERSDIANHIRQLDSIWSQHAPSSAR